MRTKIFLLLSAVFFMSSVLMGCEQQRGLQEDMEETGEDVGEGIQDTGENIGEGIEDTGEQMR